MSWGYYPKRPTMGEIGISARASARELEKKGRTLQPVDVPKNTRTIAKSWWGNAWFANLERYADYSNRIGRGKSYVRAGAVLDLQIEPGKVTALVQGSRKKPYEVEIEIDPLASKEMDRITAVCSSRINNLDTLLNGQFPADLQELFTAKGGLFPSPREIHFHCSCPDWASMCKHVASALYGIGARFDDDPLMFFRLRGIDAEALVAKAVENKLESMLANATRPSPRIMGDEWRDVFGLPEWTEEDPVFPPDAQEHA